jgi:hypothetical protein
VSVWFLNADVDNFAAISPADSSTWELLNKLDGRPFEGDWPRPVFERLPTGPAGDFAYLASHVVALTDRAWSVLEPNIGDSVQALPLDVQGEGYQVLNVLDVVDGLDRDRAELRTLDDGSVLGVSSWALKQEAVDGHDIFKIRGAELQAVLVSDRFRGWVEAAELSGAKFDPVEDSG